MTDGLHGQTTTENRERIADLETQVDTLEQDLAEQTALVNALQAKLNHLQERVDDLEADTTTTDTASATSHGATVDSYDAAVLDALDQQLERADGPVAVTPSELRRLYQTQTRITNPSTIKQRVKGLTTHDAFDQQVSGNGHLRWYYTGRDTTTTADGGETDG